MALALPEKPPNGAKDKADDTHHYGERGQQNQRAKMTKHCIGIIDTARLKMSGECPCGIDLLDDEDGKRCQSTTATPKHTSEKSRLGSRRQLRLKLATKLRVL